MSDNSGKHGRETGAVYGATTSLIDGYFSHVGDLDSIKSSAELSRHLSRFSLPSSRWKPIRSRASVSWMVE